MPGDSEHPVTFGDLRVDCEHGSQNEHLIVDPDNPPKKKVCPGGRPATVADLVSALRAEGVLVIQKVNGDWPDWLTDVDGPIWHQCGQTWGLLDDIFDALAEAQPFPSAGR